MPKKFFILPLLFIGWLLLPGSVTAQTASVNSVTDNRGSYTNSQIPKYSKFEITFQLSKSYPNPYYFYDPTDNPATNTLPGRISPYGVDGVTVDAHFTSPSGKNQTVPAFFYQRYSGTGNNLTSYEDYSWKVRFAPTEAGQYNYYLTVTDKDGTTRYPSSGSLNFTAASSSSKGFVRVSPRDSRFMEFDNGESFIPIGSAHQWWRCCGLRTNDYINTFSDFNAHGINWVRIWIQNDGYSQTIEGRYDAYRYPDDYNPEETGVDISAIPKGTQINQRGAYEMDIIVDSAEQNGVYMILCSHGDPYWIWEGSVYNAPWNTTRVGFDDINHIRNWQRNFRARVARWGYSTSVAVWETWNEHGHVPVDSAAYRFYQQYGDYRKQTDPYGHLMGTSQGSQAYSAAFWSMPQLDIVSYHDYMMISRYPADLTYDATRFVYRFAECLRRTDTRTCQLVGDLSLWSGPPKPIYWGELDTGGTEWNEPNPSYIADHNMIWAGLFSPAGSGPIDWYYTQKDSYIQQIYDEKLIASRYFEDIDYAGKNFTFIPTSDIINPNYTGELLTSTDPILRGLAMRAQARNEVYLWVQNSNHRWGNGGSANPAPVTGTISIPGVASGSYRVERWNTYTGQVTTEQNTISPNTSGNLAVSVNSLSTDQAIKIRPAGGLPTPTPTPMPDPLPSPSPTPTPSPVCRADVNGNGMVEIGDVSGILFYWGQSCAANMSACVADVNGNSNVEVGDIAGVLFYWGQQCQ